MNLNDRFNYLAHTHTYLSICPVGVHVQTDRYVFLYNEYLLGQASHGFNEPAEYRETITVLILTAIEKAPVYSNKNRKKVQQTLIKPATDGQILVLVSLSNRMIAFQK